MPILMDMPTPSNKPKLQIQNAEQQAMYDTVTDQITKKAVTKKASSGTRKTKEDRIPAPIETIMPKFALLQNPTRKDPHHNKSKIANTNSATMGIAKQEKAMKKFSNKVVAQRLVMIALIMAIVPVLAIAIPAWANSHTGKYAGAHADNIPSGVVTSGTPNAATAIPTVNGGGVGFAPQGLPSHPDTKHTPIAVLPSSGNGGFLPVPQGSDIQGVGPQTSGSGILPTATISTTLTATPTNH